MNYIIGLVLLMCTWQTQYCNSQTVKIAYVDLLSIESSFQDYQQAKLQLELYKTNQQKELDDLEREIGKLHFAAGNSALERASAEQKITDLKLKMQNKLTKQASDAEVKRREIIDPIKYKVSEAIKAVALENGFTNVFPKEVGLYFIASSDITEKVRKKLGF